MTLNSKMFATKAMSLLVLAALCAPGVRALDTGAEGVRTEKSFTLKNGGELALSNDRGSLTITGWDKEEASVVVVKHYEGDSRDRDEWLQNTTVDFDSQPNRLSIKVKRADITCFWYCNHNAWVDITIRVPKHVNLDLNTDRTTIVASDTEGKVSVHADRSPIKLHDIAGGFDIHSSRGEVDMRDIQATAGLRVDVERANAEIQAAHLAQGGELHADRGNIVVRLPENEKLTLEVDRDRRSGFRSDFPVTTTGNWTGYGRMHGEINGGGPQLKMGSDRGNITVEKTLARSL